MLSERAAPLQVLPGLYVGGHDEVEARLLDGRAAPEDTAWYLQYAGWGEGQLAEECRRRVWYPVSCSTNLLTQAVEGDGTHVWHTIMELVNGAAPFCGSAMQAIVLHALLLHSIGRCALISVGHEQAPRGYTSLQTGACFADDFRRVSEQARQDAGSQNSP